MPNRIRLVLSVAVSLVACGGSQSRGSSAPAREPSTEPASASPSPTSAGGSDAGAPASGDAGDPRVMNVNGRAGDPNTIDISGQSDLPANIPSTAQPYLRIIEVAVAPTRPALAECVHELGAHAPRFFRVTVELDGRVAPRAPQPVPLPPRVAACLEGIVQSTTVNPPPPMSIPYDIFIPQH